MINRTTIQSPFGSIVLFWTTFRREPRVSRIVIPRPGCSAELIASEIFPESAESSCMEIDSISIDIEAFLNGDAIEFPLNIVHMNQCTPFQQEVLKIEHATPRGSICTYKSIGEKLKKPNASRAIGNSLARNPFPIIIPCHRAIKSDDSLGGFQGGVEMKKKITG